MSKFDSFDPDLYNHYRITENNDRSKIAGCFMIRKDVSFEDFIELASLFAIEFYGKEYFGKLTSIAPLMFSYGMNCIVGSKDSKKAHRDNIFMFKEFE